MSPDELRLTALRPIGARSLTSNGQQAQTAEMRPASPEPSLHTDVVAGMLSLLETIANRQGSHLLRIWVSPNTVQFRAAAASGSSGSAAPSRQLQTDGGYVEAMESTKSLHHASALVSMECDEEAAAC